MSLEGTSKRIIVEAIAQPAPPQAPAPETPRPLEPTAKQ
jgi:hypothetical protein